MATSGMGYFPSSRELKFCLIEVEKNQIERDDANGCCGTVVRRYKAMARESRTACALQSCSSTINVMQAALNTLRALWEGSATLIDH